MHFLRRVISIVLKMVHNIHVRYAFKRILMKEQGYKVIFTFIILCSFSAFTSKTIFAQTLTLDNYFLGTELSQGAIFKHSQEVAHISNANPSSIEIHLRHRFTGKELWESRLNYPSAGWFLGYTDMNNPEVLGEAFHLGTYMAFPLIRKNRAEFEFRIGTGITYVTKKFDLENNRKNTLYSTDFSGLGYVRFHFNYELSQRCFASGGFGLSHFSNASTKLPNLGANILAANIGLYYKLNSKELIQTKPEKSEEVPQNKYLLNIGIGSGIKSTFPISDKRYGIYTLMIQGERKNKGLGSWLFGIDLNKNTSLRDELEFLFPEQVFKNDYRAAVLGGYSLNLGKLSGLAQVGVYLYSPVDPPRPFYQKIGFRYRVFEDFALGLNLKAHGGVADFVEYVLTYKI